MTLPKFFRIFFLTILTMLNFSCKTSQLDPAQYVRWLDDSENKMIKDYFQNNIKLTCQYTTPEYVVLKQSDPQNLDEMLIKENIDAIDDMVHFKLQFEDTTSGNFLRNNYTTAEEFNTRSMYLSYDIQFDLKVVVGGDTSECAMNHHERTYGNTPYETLLISFPRTNKEIVDIELIFNDRVFGLGRVKFFFSKEDLEAIPKLVF